MDAIVTPAEGGAGSEAAPQHRDVLAHDGEGLGERQAELGLHAGAMADTDPEAEAASRRLRERQRRLGHGDGMARVHGNDTVAEPEAAGGSAIRREHDERIAAKAMRHPRAVVAEGLDAPGEVDGSG